MKRSVLILGLILLLLSGLNFSITASDSPHNETKDSLVIQSSRSNKKLTVYSGMRIKLRTKNGSVIKGNFESLDGLKIKVKAEDTIKHVDIDGVDSYFIYNKKKEVGSKIMIGAGFVFLAATISAWIWSILFNGGIYLAVFIPLTCIFFLPALAFLILGNKLLRQKFNMRKRWKFIKVK